MIRFKDLLDVVYENNPNADLELLEEVYRFAEDLHKGQVRKSGIIIILRLLPSLSRSKKPNSSKIPSQPLIQDSLGSAKCSRFTKSANSPFVNRQSADLSGRLAVHVRGNGR